MKFIDINKRFSEIVSSFLTAGYQFNTATMGGSQGEVAKVDLTNGTEIIRIVLESFFTYDGVCLDGYRIITGVSTDNLIPNSSNDQTFWTSHMSVRECEEYYKLYSISYNDIVFGTKDDAIAIAKKKNERWARQSSSEECFKPSEKVIELAKQIIRNKFGYRRICTDEIRITKSSGQYCVSYRDCCYKLH